jgi:hypothetical protein
MGADVCHFGGQEVSLSVEFPCINEREMERGSLRSW